MDNLPNADSQDAQDVDVALREQALEDEATRLIDELPTMVALRKKEERLPELDLDEAPLDDDYESQAAEPEQLDDTVLVEPEEESEAEPEIEPEPEIEATTFRPLPADIGRPIDDNHIGVRRTRDYDHDAQSTNLAASADNFQTIREDRSERGSRRDPYARSARKGKTPGEGNSRSKLRPLLALFVIALVLGGGGAVLTYGMELWGGKTVPYVVGESQANAEVRVTDKGLTVRIEATPADDAIGKVVGQDPESGERIPEGSEVILYVATNRTMPEVVGLTEDEARALLSEAGAEKIETKTKSSSQAEGTVIEVSPAAGEAFVSRGVVTLTVAAPFRVPDVIGKKEVDAVDTLKASGYEVEVSYIVSDKTVRTVVETSPAAGETISEGGKVQVKVSTPYPTNVLHFAEYFDHSSQDVDTYLQKEGYSFDQGFIDSYGTAVAAYTSSENGNITFSSQPYSHSMNFPKKGSSNVLSTGAPFSGVRFDFPSWQVPGSYDRSTLGELAKEFGFTDVEDYCDNTSMTLPAGTAATSASFGCISGKMDNLVWTLLVVGKGGTVRASATCAKEGLYSSSDLNAFGGSVAQFVAYQEVYLSPEYQVKEETKDENKDDEKKDEAEDGDEQSDDKQG